MDKKQYHKEYSKKYYQKHKKELDRKTRLWIKKHPEKRRQWAREQYWKNGGKIRAIDYLEAHYEWKKNHPEAVSAHRKVKWAIKTGRLIKPNECSKCKSKIYLSAHHEDYLKPLQVLWLCASCHKLQHG